MPFDVFAIYPAVEFARDIVVPELKEEMLPEGVAIQTVTAAVDLDNDGEPDLLEAIDSESDNSALGYHSLQKNFKKVKGSWKLVDDAYPN